MLLPDQDFNYSPSYIHNAPPANPAFYTSATFPPNFRAWPKSFRTISIIGYPPPQPFSLLASRQLIHLIDSDLLIVYAPARMGIAKPYESLMPSHSEF